MRVVKFTITNYGCMVHPCLFRIVMHPCPSVSWFTLVLSVVPHWFSLSYCMIAKFQARYSFLFHLLFTSLPLLRNSRARSDFMFELSRRYSSLLCFVSVHFLYVPRNLLCHNDVIQQQKRSWMYTVHGLYCYKQNNDHTNLWMKVILSRGMILCRLIFLLFLVCQV